MSDQTPKHHERLSAGDQERLSKFLSYVLRHRPDSIGLNLDAQGWADVDDLLAKSTGVGTAITFADLLEVVLASEKQRFTLSPDKTRIRAAQGHSITVDLGLSPCQPPNVLYHGTATRFVEAILREGVQPVSRAQVHLSVDEETARSVGQRHGKPAIFFVDSLEMYKRGLQFFLAENGVWLTNYVPPEFVALSSNTADSAITSKHPKLSK